VVIPTQREKWQREVVRENLVETMDALMEAMEKAGLR